MSGPFEHSLTVLKDEPWKNARSIVSPTFSTAKLKAVINFILKLFIIIIFLLRCLI